MSRRPIAFNNSSKTDNSIKKNKIEIGLTSADYSTNPGGVTWFNGVDSTSQYVIYSDTFSLGTSTLANSKPVCWATGDFTDANVLRIINGLPTRYNQTRFTTIASALEFIAGSTIYSMVGGTLDNIVTNGLILNLDCSQKNSYPGSGTIWYDLSGNGDDGVLSNGSTFNSANGGSIVFDGVDDYVLTPSLLDASLNPNESVFVWFNPTAAGQIVSELGQAVINSTWHDSNIEVNSSGIFSFSVWHNGLTNKVVSSAKSFNNWYHLGFTYSGTTFTAYINGSSIGTTTLIRQAPSSLHYGLCSIDSTNMGTNAYGSGKMGNFMFYNRALTATEVTQNFNAQKSKFGL